METGTLHITTIQRGKLIARIEFNKSNGDIGKITVNFWQPQQSDVSYDNTNCHFSRTNGQLQKIRLLDGRVIEKNIPRDTHLPDSFIPSSTFLPGDTIAALSGVTPDNFLLKWQKAPRFANAEKKFVFFKKDRSGENFKINASFGNIDFKALAERELSNAISLMGDNQIKKLEMATQWRMVQGLGIESVYEISMTLHHIYGIPYIPASVLKGVTRSWIITNAYSGKEEIAISDPKFCDWFGCPAELVVHQNQSIRRYGSFYKEARKGELVFFDAYPLNTPQLDVDIMNPHYNPYYSDKNGNTPPADNYNPVPIFFLTVSKNTPFQFVLGGKEGILNQSIKHQDLENGNWNIFDWLKDALIQHGVGAKTAVGYGYMQSQ